MTKLHREAIQKAAAFAAFMLAVSFVLAVVLTAV